MMSAEKPQPVRLDLRPYVVAVVACDERFNNDDSGVAKARAAYEAGTHTMCQHRDRGRKFLLSIPQRKRTPRPRYFALGHAPLAI